MIVSQKREYVFISIPRTASRAVDKWLLDVCDGVRPGSVPDFGTDGHHRLSVPKDYVQYKRFSIIREPVSRLESYFRDTWIGSPEDDEEYSFYFKRWLRKMVASRSDKEVHDFHGSQYAWLELCSVDRVLVYEMLPDCLGSLWFASPGEFERLETFGNRVPKKFEISNDCHEFVKSCFPEDFELFERYSNCPEFSWRDIDMRDYPSYPKDSGKEDDEADLDSILSEKRALCKGSGSAAVM